MAKKLQKFIFKKWSLKDIAWPKTWPSKNTTEGFGEIYPPLPKRTPSTIKVAPKRKLSLPKWREIKP